MNKELTHPTRIQSGREVLIDITYRGGTYFGFAMVVDGPCSLMVVPDGWKHPIAVSRSEVIARVIKRKLPPKG